MSKKTAIITATFVFVATCLTPVIMRSIQARSESALETCVGYLCQIDGSKEQWAIEHHANSNAIPTWDDLYPYVKGKSGGEPFVHCPSGGIYAIGRVCVFPSCSIPKHTARFMQQTRSNPTNPPVLDEVRVLAIARAAVATNDTWLDRAKFETPKPQSDGSWSVWVWRLPATPGGYRVITTDAKGQIKDYGRGL